ncbi:hypothetical protein DY000_02039821 [Brassica cretica]|uniref:Uncharacterized protein n=1 Tax=Brassica cretica TaxID=69181 RepID=A0ABQ7BJU3_BRACR|nr:hypothetical protein DY000_02039821 [Brassica cretica]
MESTVEVSALDLLSRQWSRMKRKRKLEINGGPIFDGYDDKDQNFDDTVGGCILKSCCSDEIGAGMVSDNTVDIDGVEYRTCDAKIFMAHHGDLTSVFYDEEVEPPDCALSSVHCFGFIGMINKQTYQFRLESPPAAFTLVVVHLRSKLVNTCSSDFMVLSILGTSSTMNVTPKVISGEPSDQFSQRNLLKKKDTWKSECIPNFAEFYGVHPHRFSLSFVT